MLAEAKESAMGVGTELYRTARFIFTHPLGSRSKVKSLSRWLSWQVKSRVISGPIEVPFVGDTVLVVERGMTGATGNVYVGLHEFTDMAFLLHFVRPGELFVDVGANVGTYTVLASGARGAEAIAVEPDPSTFAKLSANAKANGLGAKATLMNAGLSSAPGTLRFTRGLDVVNHVALASDGADTIAVEVTTLDTVLAGRRASVVKIDVEGFESSVLAGAREALSAGRIDAIIIELNGSGARYGFDDAAIHRDLVAAGLTPCTYWPFERRLERLGAERNLTAPNTIYVRDLADAARRLQSSPPFDVIGQSV